jgi:hypothetical protein
MAERTIRHLGFWYMVELEDRFHPGKTYWIERTAQQGETVDIPREEDIARGEEHHAFVTEEDEAAAKEAADAEAAEIAAAQQSQLEAQGTPAADTETDTDTEEVEEVSSISDMTDEELVAWIKEDKPTAHEVVDAAEGDPELARRLLDAEDTATGGDSRKSVISGLTAIIQQG